MMNYNPLYGSVPYLRAGGNIAFYRGGSGFRTWINNTGNWWRGNHNLSQNSQFRNSVDYLLDRGYTIDEIESLLTNGDRLSEVDISRLYGGEGGDHQMNNTERIWINRMLAHADNTGVDKKTLIEKYKNTHKNKLGAGATGDAGTEAIPGDVGESEEEAPEEEAQEQEAPAAGGGTGGSTGSTGSGPAEVGEIGASQGAGQQTGGYDLDAIQQAFDRINAYIAQQQQQQQQQSQPQQPAPEQPQYRIGVGDLLGMDRWQRNQLRRGRNVQLANGEWVNPTSRWSGRHLAHDVRTERRHGRRDARRDYLSQYYNPARKARYDKRKDSRADREASHYVNIGQYVLPYENDKA